MLLCFVAFDDVLLLPAPPFKPALELNEKPDELLLLFATFEAALRENPDKFAVEFAEQGLKGMALSSMVCCIVQCASPDEAMDAGSLIPLPVAVERLSVPLLVAGSVVGCGHSYTRNTSSAAMEASLRPLLLLLLPEPLGAKTTSLTLPLASASVVRCTHLFNIDSWLKMRTEPSTQPTAKRPSNSPAVPNRATRADASKLTVQVSDHSLPCLVWMYTWESREEQANKVPRALKARLVIKSRFGGLSKPVLFQNTTCT